MARGKHSTALFEVINASKKPPAGLKLGMGRPVAAKAAAASVLRTPKWWFKGRPAQEKKPDAAPAPPANSNDPTANVTAATLTGPRPRIAPSGNSSLPAVAPARAEPTPSPIIETIEPSEIIVAVRDFPEPEPVPGGRLTRPEGVFEEAEAASAPAVASESVVARSSAARKTPAVKKAPAMARPGASTSRSAVHFNVDHELQELTVRMRYTAAIVGAFAMLVAIASAYVVGRHMGESAPADGSVAAAAVPTSPTRTLKSGPAQPGVLDVGQNRARLASAKMDGTSSPGAVAARVDPNAARDADVDSMGLGRTVNLNYVVITAYPYELRESAAKACDFLCEHGIRCTLKLGLRRANPNWLYIVGIRGFPRRFSDNPEYIAYCNQIVALNDQYPHKSNFNRFEPTPYKWDEN